MRNVILAVLSACILLAGCNTPKRQIRKLGELSLAHPVEFARLSNLLNPCFDGKAKSDTVISIHTDTLTVAGTSDTVRVNDTVRITIKLPGKVITNTKYLTIHDTVKDNRALLVAANDFKIKSDSLVVVKTQQASTKHNLGVWRLIALCACSLILVVGVIKAYTSFSGGGLINLIKK